MTFGASGVLLPILGAAMPVLSPEWKPAAEPPQVVVGSKTFTESVILGEMAAQLARYAGAVAVHRRELGGTRVLWNALLRGDIDVYPEYTGTLSREILSDERLSSPEAIGEALRARGVLMSAPLGFNNTYILGMKAQKARGLHITTISDLRNHPELRLGFSNEFMDRGDGWPRLRTHYGLPQRDVRGLEHNLAYRGLDAGHIDVIDLYATDAEIPYYDLVELEDDAGAFPVYDAVWVYRADLVERAPEAVAALASLQGRIRKRDMVALNAAAKLDRLPERMVAAEFLSRELPFNAVNPSGGMRDRLIRHTVEHVTLVAVSLSAAVLTAVPLGIFAAYISRAGQVILGVVGIIQTIPSLALLVFMIPLVGIGGPPAMVALFLYSLLPIVRNTYTGLRDISSPIRESAEALGLSRSAMLWLVELPLASRMILAGVKTSAVINIGTATLGALIGAGGYGQPILTGIRLDDVGLILQGAVPAAMMAILAQGAFEFADRFLVPKGLRLTSRK